MDQVGLFNPDLRPNEDGLYPGRTYKWCTGNAVFPFDHGLHYTDFDLEWGDHSRMHHRIPIYALAHKRWKPHHGHEGSGPMDAEIFTTLSVCIKMSALARLTMSSYFFFLQRMLALHLTLRSGSSRNLAPTTFKREGLRPLTCRWSWVGLLVLMKKVILSFDLAIIQSVSISTQK